MGTVIAFRPRFAPFLIKIGSLGTLDHCRQEGIAVLTGTEIRPGHAYESWSAFWLGRSL